MINTVIEIITEYSATRKFLGRGYTDIEILSGKAW